MVSKSSVQLKKVPDKVAGAATEAATTAADTAKKTADAKVSEAISRIFHEHCRTWHHGPWTHSMTTSREHFFERRAREGGVRSQPDTAGVNDSGRKRCACVIV